MKKLLLAAICGSMMCANPALASSDDYFEGYGDGIDYGIWLTFCNGYEKGDYKDPDYAHYMALAYYDTLHESSKQRALVEHPTCVRY